MRWGHHEDAGDSDSLPAGMPCPVQDAGSALALAGWSTNAARKATPADRLGFAEVKVHADARCPVHSGTRVGAPFSLTISLAGVQEIGPAQPAAIAGKRRDPSLDRQQCS